MTEDLASGLDCLRAISAVAIEAIFTPFSGSGHVVHNDRRAGHTGPWRAADLYIAVGEGALWVVRSSKFGRSFPRRRLVCWIRLSSFVSTEQRAQEPGIADLG